jgi:hypothetical protein
MASSAEGSSTATLQIETLGEHLRYLPAYKVIICKDHGGVHKWESHLTNSHKVSARQRKALDELHQISSLLVDEPANITLPAPNQPPIQLLGAPLAAFACSYTDCNYITTNRKNIRVHYNKSHSWKSTKEDR